MSNVYDCAYELEKAVRNSEEFKLLQSSFAAVMANAESKKLFEDFRDTQLALQEKQIKGLEITKEEVEQAQEIVQRVQQQDIIVRLMQSEHQLNQMINDISRIIMKPLKELYGLSDQ